MTSNKEFTVTHHDPTALFLPDPSTPDSQSSPHTRKTQALIILNSPIVSLELIELLWRTCNLRICADGGANRLYEFLGEKGRRKLLPTHIHGDLDSLRDDVRSYYADKGVAITKDPDQYSTDFGKALKLIRDNVAQASNSSQADQSNTSTTDVVILGSISGRIDHGLGLLHELGREHRSSPDLRLWLVSEASVTFVLGPGQNHIIQIHSPNKTMDSQNDTSDSPDNTSNSSDSSDNVLDRHVGVVPLYGKAVISTKGLEWDVQGWESDMLGNVSTCNRVLGGTCEVGVEGERVLFTVERRRFVGEG